MLNRLLLACGKASVDLTNVLVEVFDSKGVLYASRSIDYTTLTSVTLDASMGSSLSDTHSLGRLRVTLSDGAVGEAEATSSGNSRYSAEVRMNANGETIGLKAQSVYTYMPQIPGMEYQTTTTLTKLSS